MSYNIKSLFLAILSSILLWVAWPPHNLGWIGFFGFVPLLMLHDFCGRGLLSKRVFRLLIYFSLFLWNVLTTWWIWLATPGGSMAAIALNSLLMSIVWWVFGSLSKKTNKFLGYSFLTSLWISYEFLHLNWEITWPWLVLGNIFANNTELVQWYEFTGHLGGSLWVLVSNIILFQCIKNYQVKRIFFQYLFSLSALIIIPVIISQLLSSKLTVTASSEKSIQTLIIQPNLDPYSEKFNETGDALSSQQQLEMMLQMADAKINPNTEFVILPETALQGGMNESELEKESLIIMIQDFVRRHPNTCVVTGADSYVMYSTKQTETARKYGKNGKYLDFFNSAFKIDTSTKIEIYHKSRLVPGVEKLPYPAIFGGLVHLLRLEAEAGGLGTQAEASVFTHHGLKVAPLICYESVFGGYVEHFVRKDANVIFVITNDGWWGNTDGYKQHLAYGRLRSIEFRKELLQCANTGLSAQIDTHGDIIRQSEWWTEDVLEMNFIPNNAKTFYALHGDYLGWIGVGFSAIVLTLFLVFLFVKKRNNGA